MGEQYTVRTANILQGSVYLWYTLYIYKKYTSCRICFLTLCTQSILFVYIVVWNILSYKEKSDVHNLHWLSRWRGTVASWLVCSSLDRVVRVRTLAGDIVSCSWARHFPLTVPFSTQVYKWVPANLVLGVTLRWTSIPSRGSRNTPNRFMLLKPG